MFNNKIGFLAFPVILCVLLSASPAMTFDSGDVITTVRLTNPLNEARQSAPVTWGIPLSIDDGVFDTSQIDMMLDDASIHVQFLPMAR